MKSYSHFTKEERVSLHVFLEKGYSMREMARRMERNVSSISREFKRNKNQNGTYNAWRAISLYIHRRKQSVRKRRLLYENDLIIHVQQGLDKFWSPEIIAAKWIISNPDSTLSPTTIYTAIKNKLLLGYSAKTHFRRKGKKRGLRARCVTIKPDNLIVDWPEVISERARLGDWEGDTVCGRPGTGGLITLIDRKSRFLTAALVKNRTSLEAKEAILLALKGQTVQSISLDNGSEFAEHKKISEELNVPIYFANLHSPWQRGSNENVNGLLRFFFPKGTNFLEITQERVDEVLALVNNRPRKCLGWLSPVEFLERCCT